MHKICHDFSFIGNRGLSHNSIETIRGSTFTNLPELRTLRLHNQDPGAWRHDVYICTTCGTISVKCLCVVLTSCRDDWHILRCVWEHQLELARIVGEQQQPSQLPSPSVESPTVRRLGGSVILTKQKQIFFQLLPNFYLIIFWLQLRRWQFGCWSAQLRIRRFPTPW